MKITTLLITIMSVIVLGCSNPSEQPAEVSAKAMPKNTAVDNYFPNPQVPDDRQLEQTGQTVLDGKGEITLKKGSDVNESFQIGPIEMNIIDAKIVHLKPDYSLVDYFHTLTHDEEFDFVKVFVEIKNTSDKRVNFAPVAILETSSGEKITWENDIYLDGLNEGINPNETKAGNIGFVIEKSDLQYFEITTSDVFDTNEKKLEDSKKVKIAF